MSFMVTILGLVNTTLPTAAPRYLKLNSSRKYMIDSILIGPGFSNDVVFYLYLMDEQLHQQASDVAIDWLWILVF